MSTSKFIVFVLILQCLFLDGYAQVDKRVKNAKIRDMNDNPVAIPEFGQKNLLIFYIDPDHPSQNSKFTDYLEKHQIDSPNILSFGVLNLKDAPLLPNGIVRSMARKKMQSTGATIYSDPDHLLRDAWALGDVNNKFCLLFVTKEGEIVLCKKGEMTQQEYKEVMDVIEKYK